MSVRYTPDSPEEWRTIPGWPDYEASSHGQIASIKGGVRKVLSGGKTDTGRRNVLLYQQGDRVGHRAHSLVALTFFGPRPDGLEIRHLDGDKLNNAVWNLAYGTHAENMEDRRRHRGLLLIVGTDPIPRWAQKRLPPPLRAPRTHCPQGLHLIDETTSYFYPDGRRVCRPCKTSQESASRRRRLAEASKAVAS